MNYFSREGVRVVSIIDRVPFCIMREGKFRKKYNYDSFELPADEHRRGALSALEAMSVRSKKLAVAR